MGRQPIRAKPAPNHENFCRKNSVKTMVVGRQSNQHDAESNNPMQHHQRWAACFLGRQSNNAMQHQRWAACFPKHHLFHPRSETAQKKQDNSVFDGRSIKGPKHSQPYDEKHMPNATGVRRQKRRQKHPRHRKENTRPRFER
jgi:hypothetical protein